MSPNVSTLKKDSNKTDPTVSSPEEEEEENEEKRKMEDDEMDLDDRPHVGLCRQMCVCAGLMASDGGLVFLQLAMVPCLQTLGVPVSLMTVAGVISGSLALMGLPLMGWISDGGANPHRRKKPAVVLSAMIFVTGYSLVISGCVMLLRNADQYSSRETGFSSIDLNETSSAIPQPNLNAAASSASRFPPRGANSSKLETSVQGLAALRSPKDRDSELYNSHSETLEPDMNNSNNASHSSSEWMVDPIGVGIPLTGLLGILGFVFMDMGNDFNNACLKSFVLTCTGRRQHNSLLVVGVLMSAVGGCVAAILGVLDIAALLVRGSELDAVPTKTLLQAAFFLVFTLVCMLVTLLSAPPLLPNKTEDKATLPSVEVSPVKSNDSGKNEDDFQKSDIYKNPQSTLSQSSNDNISPISGYTNSKVNCRNDDPAHVLLSEPESNKSLRTPVDNKKWLHSSEDCRELEKRTFLKSDDKTRSVDSLRSSRLGDSAINMFMAMRLPSTRSLEYVMRVNTDSPHDLTETGSCAHEMFMEQTKPQQTTETGQYSRRVRCGRFSIDRTTLKMIPVCTSMFFMAGAWQSFNICATDYLGKVVYGGDPDADRRSQSYVAYQQGITSGSLGVLMLNVAYVAVNLLQKKILGLIGPKAEYLAVCGIQVTVLVCLQLTHRVAVFYLAAVVYGLFRSLMYTVPFMLANSVCQQAVMSSSSTERGSARVGSTMALMTAMMPLSYVLVSTVTGPLIHATGDPAAPLYYAIVTTTLAAFVFAFT